MVSHVGCLKAAAQAGSLSTELLSNKVPNFIWTSVAAYLLFFSFFEIYF